MVDSDICEIYLVIELSPKASRIEPVIFLLQRLAKKSPATGLFFGRSSEFFKISDENFKMIMPATGLFFGPLSEFFWPATEFFLAGDRFFLTDHRTFFWPVIELFLADHRPFFWPVIGRFFDRSPDFFWPVIGLFLTDRRTFLAFNFRLRIRPRERLSYCKL